MPLVEVIRGENSSDETIASVVAYASKMGKTPIVVNDCPGFFVNRVLFPYFAGFSGLLADGADFAAIDKVMEKQFGWPMGPAYLLDKTHEKLSREPDVGSVAWRREALSDMIAKWDWHFVEPRIMQIYH